MMHDELLLAYIAGLFDGEGSIVIGLSKRKNNRFQYWLQVGITNTDKKLIDWLHETFGGHISHHTKALKLDTTKGYKRDCYCWRVMAKQGAAFLTMLLPYLRIKKEQALVAIEFAELLALEGALDKSKGWSEEQIAKRQWYKDKLHELKKLA